ncbi:unnamed protein product, partial [Bubo scandiacus]
MLWSGCCQGLESESLLVHGATKQQVTAKYFSLTVTRSITKDSHFNCSACQVAMCTREGKPHFFDPRMAVLEQLYLKG